MEWSDLIKLIVSATVSALVGIGAYLAKTWFESGKTIKVSARLLFWDIKSIQGHLERLLVDKRRRNTLWIQHGSISLIDNWRKEFTNVNPKLDKDETESILRFYSRVETVKAIQDHMKLLDGKPITSITVLEEKADIASNYVNVAEDIEKLDLTKLLEKLDKLS